MQMKLQDLQQKFDRLTALQSEIQQLKAEIVENEIGFAQTQAEALMAGDDKAAGMKNPGEKLRSKLSQLEAIEPHAAKIFADAAEVARKIVDAKIEPLSETENLKIVSTRAKLAEFTRLMQIELAAPSETLGALQSARGELRNASEPAEILRHVGLICAEFHLDLEQQPEILANAS